MTYVEFPFDRIVELHVKKEGEPPNGGGVPGTCVPHYTHHVLPNTIFYSGGVTTINPYFCCPPHPFTGEEAYGQKSIYASGAPGVMITWTLDMPPSDFPLDVGMGIWLFPNVSPNNIEKLYYFDKYENNTYRLYGPVGEPYQFQIVSFSDSPGVMTITVPPGLTPADIPGAPEADEGVFGTTIILSILGFKPGEGWFAIERYWSYAGSTIDIVHDCPPNTMPTAVERDVQTEGFPPYSRPERGRR